MLRILAATVLPDAGSVHILGRDAIRHPSRVRREIGFVLSEERSFYWRLTALQNLSFFATLANMNARLAENQGKVDAGVTRKLMDLRLFNEDGSFAENGGATKPTKQDADLTTHQMVADVRQRKVWLKVPVPDFFADWTEIDLKPLWD